MSNQQTGIVVLGGKEYQTVALRVQMFRKDHPEWTILTEIVERNETVVVVKATIINDQGRVIATGHAEEFRTNKGVNSTSAIENCETSSIGRALACYGLLGGGEFASANEVQHAMTAKPKAPSALETASKWGTDNASIISKLGLTDRWTKAINAAKMEELREIKMAVIEAQK